MIQALNTRENCDTIRAYAAPQPQYIEVRIAGKHLFNFDPARGVIVIRRNGEQYTVDLSQYTESAPK